MAKKLSNQKKSEYNCPAKRCPAPADFRNFPELMNYVRAEWRRRLITARARKKKV